MSENFKEFKRLKDNALTLFDKRLRTIKQSRMSFRNIVPDEVKAIMRTRSKYMSPDYYAGIMALLEFLVLNLPTFLFGASSQVANQLKRSLNSTVKSRISNSNMNFALAHAVFNALLDGVGVAETVFKEHNEKRWKLPDGSYDLSKIESVEVTERIGDIELVVYDTLNVLIDPKADPFAVRDSAEYAIVQVGDFSKDQVNTMSQEKAWTMYDPDEIQPESKYRYRNTYSREVQQKDGMATSDYEGSVLMERMYMDNGMVKTILNERFVVDERINSQLVEKMPLTFFIPQPGASPYGITQYEIQFAANFAKATMLDLIIDNAVRNAKENTYTKSKEAAKIGSKRKGATVHIPDSMQEPIDKLFYRPVHPGIDQSIVAALQQVQSDIDKTQRITSISQGVQTKQVRVAGVAQEMSAASQRSASFIINAAEQTLFAPIGRDIINIIYAYYPYFKDTNIPREELGKINSVYVKNGSSLNENNDTYVGVLQDLMLISKESPDALKYLDVVREYFDTRGLTDIDSYINTEKEIMDKRSIDSTESVSKAQDLVRRAVEGEAA